MAVPYTFATATGSLPLSQLDSNFSTAITIGNTSVVLGDTITTVNNLSLANVAITSVATQFPNGYLANSNVIVGTTTLTLGSTVTSISGLSLSNVTISSGNVTLTGANVSGTANVSTLIVTGNQTSLGNVAITGNVSANIVTVAAGAVGTPSITTTGDTNTGIFFPAADTIAFTEGGVESMRIDSSGNVGIGTTAPVSKLQVSNSTNGGAVEITAANTYYLATSTDETVAFQGEFYQDNVAANRAAGYMQIGKSGDFSNNANASAFMAFATRNAGTIAERMRIDSIGNVGIGVTPSAWLSTTKVLQIGDRASIFTNSSEQTLVGNNVYVNSSSQNTYIETALASLYQQAAGVHYWYNAPSGTAGNAITFTQAMTLDASGNVGIGVTPSFPLDVQSTGVGSTIASRIYRSDGTIALLRIGNSTSGSGSTAPAFGSDTTAAVFYTNNSEKMRIDSSGNVGIGVTPATLLNAYSATSAIISVDGDTTAIVRPTRYSTDASSPQFLARKARGTLASPTAVASSDNAGGMYIQAYGGTNFRTIARIDGFVETYTSDTNIAGSLRFYTNTSSTDVTEKMRIDSVGNAQFQTGAVMPYAPAPASISTTATLTNANIQTQIISATGTTYTITMPLGTTLETLATWATTGIAYDFYIINAASGTITLDATEVGVTSVGTMTIATGVSAQFRIRRTAANTFVVYRLG